MGHMGTLRWAIGCIPTLDLDRRQSRAWFRPGNRIISNTLNYNYFQFETDCLAVTLILQGEMMPFKPYMHRYRVPYLASKSSSPLWYAIKRASAHIIVLSSYSAYGKKNKSIVFIILNLDHINWIGYNFTHRVNTWVRKSCLDLNN